MNDDQTTKTSPDELEDFDPIARGSQHAPRTPRPEALQEAFERFTRSGAGDGQSMPRRELTFTVDPSYCEPGVFRSDFELTLRSLDSTNELAAATEAEGSGNAMMYGFAKRSVYAFDGQPIDRIRRDFLWEALGTSGRQLVLGKFGELNTASDAAKEKAHATTRISG